MKQNRKGFTLAELLIVVAIIAVLVAVAIPVFTSQLEKSREATDIANVRSAYAEVVTHYLEKASIITINVEAKQTQANWQGAGKQDTYSFAAQTAGSSYAVTLTENSDGTVVPSVG